METLKLAVVLYLLMACTVGAYRFGSMEADRYDEKLSLFHIIEAIPHAIVFEWIHVINYFTYNFRK
jgi:hypothetical protein